MGQPAEKPIEAENEKEVYSEEELEAIRDFINWRFADIEDEEVLESMLEDFLDENYPGINQE